MTEAQRLQTLALCTSTAEAFEFLLKTKKRLTLRSLARKLEVSPSYLVMLKGGKRLPKKDLLLTFGEKLQLHKSEIEVLLMLSDLDRAKTSNLRLKIRKRLIEIAGRVVMTTVDHEKFTPIARWYGLAILEVVKSKQCKLDAKSIGLHLGVSEDQVEKVLKRLVAMGVLSPALEVLTPNLLFHAKIPSQIFTNYYGELLAHSTANLRRTKAKNLPQPVISKTMAVDPEDIVLIEQEMDRFMARVRKIANQSQRKSKLYSCFLHCFPLITPKQ